MKKYHLQNVFALIVLMAIACCSTIVAQKPNSKFGGVQIGAISYSFRSMPDQSLEATLNYYIESGVSSAELMGYTVENYLGIPQTSLSIVFGTPITFSPKAESIPAVFCVPLPPIQTKQSNPNSS